MDADSDLLFPFDVFPATATGSKPRRKRTKLIQVKDHLLAPSSLGAIKKKPRYGKKPDPSAPKITRPCSECGKKFWSWKALFGHMRCHPERQWRGINPPPNVQRPTCPMEYETTEVDYEIAECLLMLANGPTTAMDQTEAVTVTGCREIGQEIETAALGGYTECSGPPSCRFECSSCKKVFGSHQALGGHRASHKNVKGCFAIARTDGGFSDAVDGSTGTGHECSVCMQVFSSGQALGGHKRRHWEKEEEDDRPYSVGKEEGCGCLDLNLPPPMEDIEDSSSSYSSGLVLDLRLGLS